MQCDTRNMDNVKVYIIKMSSDEENGELGGCELGTSVYWDKVYNSEMANYKRHGDVGEIWFGEDSMMRIVRWFLNSAQVEKSDAIIDLGCGNGMMLIELSKEGFSSLLGVDYSEAAIKLATTVAEEHSYDIKYEVLDILNEDIDKYAGKFKVVHDKGTYDAVSLNPEDTKTKRLTYIDKAADLLNAGGLLVITSCNWTESELTEHFKHKFQMKKVLPTPQFQFGGKVGNVITSMIFEKINL